jgi:anti-sigma B factor antagonist
MTGRSELPIGAPVVLPMPFSITVEPRRDAVKIAPIGELDLATVGQLQSELGGLIDAGFARVVIDLRGVEFLDSSALHALLTAQAQARHDNWELTIIPGPRAVQRIFEITGTINRLPFATADCRAVPR